MTRTQFTILICLSCLLVVFLIGHIFLVRAANFQQFRLSQTQQYLNEAQRLQNNMGQLAARIYQDAQKTQDQQLKDLLTSQGFPANPTPSNPSPAAATAPAGSSTR